MAAVEGLKQLLPSALRNWMDAVNPCRIVMFPAVVDFPLRPLPELKEALPAVRAKLDNGRWRIADGETVFLQALLGD